MTTDRFGATELPLDAPLSGDAAGDKALGVLAEFSKSVLNAYANDAWAAVAPGESPTVKQAYLHDPTHYFDEFTLPSLYVWRAESGQAEDVSSCIRQATSDVVMQWVFPPAYQESNRVRFPILNGVHRVLDRAIEKGRDPAFLYQHDTNEASVSQAADTDAIKLAVQTEASAQSYYGAALDGSTGDDALPVGRYPTATLGGATSSFTDGAIITWTGLNKAGKTVTTSKQITASSVPYTLKADRPLYLVSQIDVEANAGTLGTIEFGLAARAGLGSDLLVVAGLERLDLLSARQVKVRIPIVMADGHVSETRVFEAIEMRAQFREIFYRGTDEQELLAGIDVDQLTESEDLFQQLELR